ncbi:MAG: four helix bundle protein [Bacteroidales bacterium]|nr:four helix bundle protein [Lentimicrobiaceae bacterium]MDD5694726.1 four helix bundle protein [Bacteroidales bacterium]
MNSEKNNRMENGNDNLTTFFRFEDLRVYHKALEYINWVHSIVRKFPEKEGGGITNKFTHAAESIALSIAEGSARNRVQFVFYLKAAKSSIRECVVFTSIARSLDYLDDDREQESREHLMEMTKMVGALIGSLQRNTTAGERNENA